MRKYAINQNKKTPQFSCCIHLCYRFTNLEAAQDKDHAARLSCSIQQLLACEAEIEGFLCEILLCRIFLDEIASLDWGYVPSITIVKICYRTY